MLTGLLGTGGGLLLVGLGWIVSFFADSVPGKKGDEVALVFALILMLLGGVEMVYVGVGQFAVSLMQGVAGWAGRVGIVIFILIGVFLVGTYLKAALKRDEKGNDKRGRVVWLAFALPFFLAVPSHGALHDLSIQLKQPAEQVTATLQAKLGA